VFTLRRYADTAANDAEEYRRAVRLLIQGAALHSVEFDSGDYVEFRERSERILKDLVESATPVAAISAAGAMNHALQNYNQTVLQRFRMRQNYLLEMIRMLSGAIGEFTESGQSSIRQLQDVERSIESAADLEDFLQVRASLAESLKAIRLEVQTQRERSMQYLHQCERQLQQQTGLTVPKSVRRPQAGEDARTGLPTRGEAVQAIADALQSPRQTFIAAVKMDRYAAISQRYGYAFADKALLLLTNHLVSRLSPDDRFFSWGDASVVAVLERERPYETVKRELQQALSERIEATIRAQNRDVLLHVQAAWLLLPVASATSLEILLERLEMFLDAGGDAKL
jgi:GGDEF domain-containing protein